MTTLEKLGVHWEAFTADQEARLLRWLVDDDSATLVETFIQVEASEAGSAPDLFLVFENAFESADSYGASMLADLTEALTREQEEIAEAGFTTSWSPPERRAARSDGQAFADAMVSLGEYYASDIDHIAVVLLPAAVDDPAARQAWIGEVISEIDERVRVVTVEQTDEQHLAKLAEEHPELVRDVEPRIDFIDLLKQIAAAAGGSGPGVGYRRHLLDLMGAARGTDPAAIAAASDRALAIAREQSWRSLESLVHVIVGGTLVAAGKPKDAVAAYEQAEAAVADAPVETEPAAPKVQLQARLSKGSALISAKDFAEAAEVFESAVPLADGDTLMTIECWRLASFCHERSKRREESWRCGQEALAAGETMAPDEREATTLAYAAEGMMRLSKKRPFKRERKDLESRIVDLLGDAWRDQIEGAS